MCKKTVPVEIKLKHTMTKTNMKQKPFYIIVNKNTGYTWNNRTYGSLSAVKVARFYMPKHVVESYRVYRLQFADDAPPDFELVVYYAELGQV